MCLTLSLWNKITVGSLLCACNYSVSLELLDSRPRDYLSREVFPTMIPALNQMLRVAKVTEVSKNTPCRAISEVSVSTSEKKEV